MVRCILVVVVSIFTSIRVSAQISIDEYRDVVVDYSRSLRTRSMQIDAAAAEVRRTMSAMLPSLSVDANFDIDFGSAGGERRWSWGVRPQLSQTLYGGGGMRAERSQANIALDIASSDFESGMLDVIYVAESAYWQLSRAEIYCRAIEDYLNIVGSLRGVVEQRYMEGYISKSDLLQVDSRMSDAEYQLSAARQDYLVALHNFNSLRGESAHSDVMLSASILDTLPMPHRCTVQELLSAHPRYESALSATLSAEWDIRRVNARYMPNLSVGVFGLWQPAVPNVKGAGTMLDGGAFVGLSVPIYHFGERRHAVRRARSNYEASNWQCEEIRDRLILDESNGWTNLQNSYSRVAATRRNLDIAQENLEISTYSYNEGMVTILDVLQAQISWLQIYTNAITAQYDYAVAVAAYRYITATMP